MARSMLKKIQIPNNLWGEATSNDVHIRKVCSTKNRRNMTPRGDWTGLKPKCWLFNHIWITFSKHVLEQLRRKIDDTSQVTTFIGYHSIMHRNYSHKMRINW